MRIRSFQEMLLEYNIPELEPDDKLERNKMLSKHSYSIILEGEYMELDNLAKWITINVGKDAIRFLFYGKVGYNYCFGEYFFDNEKQVLEVAKAIPNIYTLYPASIKRNHICKSDGYEVEVGYEPENKDAILLDKL